MKRMAALAATTMIAACGTTETGELGAFGLSPGGCDAENGTRALHWSPGSRCLWVSYDPELSPIANDLAVAMETWSALECSGLCFDGPFEDEIDPEDAPHGRIHFVPNVSSGPNVGITTLTFSHDGLELLLAIGTIDLEHLAELEATEPGLAAGALLGALGETLGLPSAPTGMRSVLANSSQDLAPELTEPDVAAFCGVYGEGGVCEIRP